MAEYIDREALLAHLRKCKETSTGSGLIAAVITAIQSFVEEMPAADVAPVAHGKWVPSEGNPGFLVCPACGAKMDGKGEDT